MHCDYIHFIILPLTSALPPILFCSTDPSICPHAPPAISHPQPSSIIFFLIISWPHPARILVTYPEDKAPPHSFHPSVLTVPSPSSVTFPRPQGQCHGFSALKSLSSHLYSPLHQLWDPTPTAAHAFLYMCILVDPLQQPYFPHILVPWFFFKLLSP